MNTPAASACPPPHWFVQKECEKAYWYHLPSKGLVQMLAKTRLSSFVAFKYFQMECICPTAVSTPERHFSPDCCFGWPSNLGNTGHRNPVKLFNSFSLLADKEFIYTENIQKCASRLMWGIGQHPQEAQLHRLCVRRCDCRTKWEQSLELWLAWRSDQRWLAHWLWFFKQKKVALCTVCHLSAEIFAAECCAYCRFT